MKYYDAVLAYEDEDGLFPPSLFRFPVQPLSDPVNESATQHCKEYVQTDPESWNLLKDDTP